jgi:hypothetical protein
MTGPTVNSRFPSGMTDKKSKGDGSLTFVDPTLSTVKLPRGWGIRVGSATEKCKGENNSRSPLGITTKRCRGYRLLLLVHCL